MPTWLLAVGTAFKWIWDKGTGWARQERTRAREDVTAMRREGAELDDPMEVPRDDRR